MFSKVVDMNVGYFSDQRKGDIISKITSDVGVVQFCITNTLQVSFREPFLIIGYIVMMVAISWELALFSILFLPIVGNASSIPIDRMSIETLSIFLSRMSINSFCIRQK